MPREVLNGRVRWPKAEAEADSFLSLLVSGGRLKEPPPPFGPDGHVYLAGLMDGDPWVEFHGGLAPPAKTYPAGFLDVFGPEPGSGPGEILDNDTRGARDEWLQELGYWYDNKRPDWANDVMNAFAVEYFAAHGVGRIMPFRLKVGDVIVERAMFPDADKRAARQRVPRNLVLPAELVWRLPDYGLTVYQTWLRGAGVEIPLEHLSRLLRQDPGTMHSG